MFNFILKMFSIKSLLTALSNFEDSPEGKLAIMLIRMNNPEKVAALELIKEMVEGKK